MFTIMRELYISDCFNMTYISMCAGSVFDNIKKMDFSLRIAYQDEMTYFGEKSNNL